MIFAAARITLLEDPELLPFTTGKMSDREFLKLFASITYKPNVKMKVAMGSLVITKTVQDATHAERSMISLRIVEKIDAINLFSEKAFLKFVYNLLVKMELHEVDEWLKVDGKPVNDPHQ